ncbi:hypothetical protein TanjilG_13473 [Lupinus angustifolius]|uniref:BHLH domain-containing protein n=1 Tax=Lupinus angustifolius TaxID=3871 RepID=A0A394DEW8_LUPAN|nr:PREDICTED: putative transcription factor bHLH041 [Lupinus angustifolius]OIW18720.1 hypothetical protein TanjilG_13472 [Lupinus angustifolius]OIW18721.1 hypothetical protein TanjilG_13473 [Lupinus angustifolius]
MHPMDGIFSLSEATRTDFLSALVLHLSGCAYICLWRYDSCLTNRLLFLDGFYNVNNQPNSSLARNSVAEELFNLYQSLTFDVNVDSIPGLAFRNHNPYLELQQLDLLRLVSTEIQVQFFKEARIKTAVFMGCSKGEIELGFTNMSQVDIEAALRGLFPEDFFRQTQRINYQNPHSSSSSYSISLSTGSPECSSLLINNIPVTSMSHHFPETLGSMVPKMQPIEARPIHQQAIQALGQVIPCHFATPEVEHDDAIIRAMIHVISSSSTSDHKHRIPQQNLPYTSSSLVHPVNITAFKKYSADNKGPDPHIRSNPPRQSLLKKSFACSRSLNSLRIRERIQEAARFTSTQQQRMMSERRRREKLNENFQALRELLPPKTKKDKASILTAAKEKLKSLTAEIEKFNIRNQQLTTFLSTIEANASNSNFSNEQLKIRVSNVPQSSLSEERMVDLHVTVRGESSQVDISIRLLEFLKRIQNLSLICMEANTHVTEGTTINQLTFRIGIIEGSAWNECTFVEAVRRIVADLLHGHVGK